MLPVDDIGIAIADVYAKSLYKLASADSTQTSMHEELCDLVKYVNETSAFEHFLTSATIDTDRRRESLERAMRGKASDLLVNFLQVLNTKDRLSLLEQISVQFRFAIEHELKQVEVDVTTAVALSSSLRESLMAELQKMTGKEPILTEKVRPDIIGGLILLIGDRKIDFSVARRLDGYRDALITRASHEIHSGREYFQQT
jgi:F-type H+-transporting ATPase subunit delta